MKRPSHLDNVRASLLLNDVQPDFRQSVLHKSSGSNDLANDYQQVTVWDATYLTEHKLVTRPWWEYCTGTMTDLHIMAQYNVYLAHIDGFFRTFGKFILWFPFLRKSNSTRKCNFGGKSFCELKVFFLEQNNLARQKHSIADLLIYL